MLKKTLMAACAAACLVATPAKADSFLSNEGMGGFYNPKTSMQQSSNAHYAAGAVAKQVEDAKNGELTGSTKAYVTQYHNYDYRGADIDHNYENNTFSTVESNGSKTVVTTNNEINVDGNKNDVNIGNDLNASADTTDTNVAANASITQDGDANQTVTGGQHVNEESHAGYR